MSSPPRDRAPDSTLALAVQGYGFIRRRTRRRGADVAETRLLLQPTTLVVGEEAARVLYDTTKFSRAGAMPLPVQQTLLGVGGVQGLDGEAHRARKAMFLALLRPDRAGEVAETAAACWREAVERWERVDEVVLLDEVAEVLCRAVCTWAGVPLAAAEVARRTRDLRALIEPEHDLPVGYVRARRARRRSEAWCASLVEAVRDGSLDAPAGSALRAVATYREPDGRLLEPRIAAVELLNVLRPTVAVHRYVVLCALALLLHPGWRERLAAADDDVIPFVHEVRRYYPFFPAVAGRVREPFTWRGAAFPRGRRVMLDLYGTNRDPRSWDDPEAFRPERFRSWGDSAYDFVPQGGGDHAAGHRCPGEWVTIELMAMAVRMLCREMEYDVPAQDLRVTTRSMPTGPASGLVVRRVRARRT